MNMDFNTQQREAVEHEGGHVLVLAGAGTGKTRTIIGRAAWLLETGSTPQRILVLTFTRRAAREITDRLAAMGRRDAGLISAGTFHHFCLREIRRRPSAFGVERATIIDHDDQTQLMKLAKAEVGSPLVKSIRPAELVSLNSYARNSGLAPQAHLERQSSFDPDTSKAVLDVFACYERRKRRMDYLDYDDIIDVFAPKCEEIEGLRNAVTSQFDHVLVDEAQDTNPAQWHVLHLLRDPAKLYCVGDDAQSIYAFRGADFKVVHEFPSRVPGAATRKLEENYRSRQEILDAANWLLEQSPLQYGKRLVANRGRGGVKPVLAEFENEWEEADWVANDLAARHAAGAAWRSHMIIIRTGYAGRPVESALVKNDIPYRFIGGIGILETAHVKDVLSMIRASDSHRDEIAWMRYLALWPKVGEVKAARTTEAARSCTTIDDAIRAVAGDAKITDAARALADLRGISGDNATTIREAVKSLAPLLSQKYDDWSMRMKDFEALAILASKHATIHAFLETFTLDPTTSSEATRNADDDMVTLITAHSAKGTECPVVYIVRADPGMFPHAKSADDPDKLEEERRVLYVAITRAMDELIITRTQLWWQPPNYFLDEIPENLFTLLDPSDEPEFPARGAFRLAPPPSKCTTFAGTPYRPPSGTGRRAPPRPSKNADDDIPF